ncbi:MAG: FAD-dependent oxidoreductase [Rhizobium sp.]
MNFPSLFSAAKIGAMEIKNRFVVPAMGTNYSNPDGSVSQQLIDYYVERAKGGFGLIIVEVAAVDPLAKAAPYQSALWSDDFIPGWSSLVEQVHEHGAKIALQLHHAGRQTLKQIIGAQPVAPSPLPCPMLREVPRELATEEVHEIIAKFRDAAVRAQTAGFDAVELHGAHGYLIAQFMSSETNRRFDEFGGDIASRMKFPVEIVKSIKNAAGNDYPVLFRISGDEKTAGGWTLQDTRVAVRILEKAGVDALNVSVGTYGSYAYMVAPAAAHQPGYNVYAAAEVKECVRVPVIAVGRINNPYLAQDIVDSGKADFVALGRESICDPDFPNKVMTGAMSEIRPCLACNQGCIGHLADPEFLEVTCLMNPFVGREGSWKIERSETPKKVMVVGGGPAGLQFSWIAAMRGHHVTCYEKKNTMGGTFRVAGLPPGKQDLERAIGYLLTMCKKHDVVVKMNAEVTPQTIESESPDVVVFAQGGDLRELHARGLENVALVTANDVLEGKIVVGKRVLIVGGGMVGAETADFLMGYGHALTIVGRGPEIAKDLPFVNRDVLLGRLKSHGVELITDTIVAGFTKDRVILKRKSSDIEETIPAFDSVVIALGTSPNDALVKTVRGLVESVHVVGDALKSRTALEAIDEATKVGLAI